MTGADDFGALLADLAAETVALQDLLGRLSPEQWSAPTPAEGWTVHDQVTHLMYFDEAAALAVTDPDRFRQSAAELLRGGPDFPDEVAAGLRSIRPEEALTRFGRARAELIAVYEKQDRRRRLPWYGPEMSVMSAATARLMETWAHGVDIADAVGVPVTSSRRLRHIAYLGVATRRFSFKIHGLEAPAEDPRVELDAGEGETWSFGPAGAAERLAGTALDFCLVVTQRRMAAQTGLQMQGSSVEAWMAVAQAFAGRPTTARPR